MAENKIFTVAVVGPTASGKTDLAISIAKKIGGEIVSADSMQIYKGMPIATACPTSEQKKEVPHHLVEFLENSENFSVAEYVSLAKKKIKEIADRNAVPVIVAEPDCISILCLTIFLLRPIKVAKKSNKE